MSVASTAKRRRKQAKHSKIYRPRAKPVTDARVSPFQPKKGKR
jgi:hypothetical protein